MTQHPSVSIIITAYNEAKTLPGTLDHLRQFKTITEIIVVDGGSNDGTTALAAEGFKLIQSARGRANQMNAGAAQASGELLLFLHSDTRLPGDWEQQIKKLDTGNVGGAFKVKFDAPGLFFALAAIGSNCRAAMTGIYFGDQAIFARRDSFNRIGGFPPLEILEDWEFSRKLRQAGKTVLLPGPVITSARRWLIYGKWRTAWLMHKIKLFYLLGVSPAELKKMYTDKR
ncbi:MAG: Poly-beta-1,6-N-acetyl-D-glucosamine synthase [Pelotomaculum sp. PtaB.Bin104]|nr:MAG: Poly-beta-1,6-N-acetyl-D-glucosamine synthase [Pelotomaculum sp. PtaB.Bin104]